MSPGSELANAPRYSGFLTRNPSWVRSAYLLALLGLFVLGVWVSLYSTSSGIGLESDSYIYSAAARSVLRGQGYRTPLSPGNWVRTAHFPPLYPYLLAAGSLLTRDLNEAARWLNAGLLGANVSLVAYTAFRITGGSIWAAVAGASLVIGADGLLLVHAHLWSEPTFLFFTLLGLLYLDRYLEQPLLIRLIVAAAIVALAFLTRYLGAVLILTGAVAIALQKKSAASQKLKYVLVFFLVSAAPCMFWMAQNFSITGSFTNRQFSIHWINFQDLIAGAQAVMHWLIPNQITNLSSTPSLLFRIVIALTMLTVPLLLTVRPGRAANRRPSTWSSLSPLPYAVFTLAYPLFLIASMSFFDAQTSLDTRILSPAMVTGTIAILPWTMRLARKAPSFSKGPLQFAVAFYLLAFGLSGWEAVRALQSGRDKGYSSSYWTESKLLNQIRGLPPSTLIYSNAQDVIFLLADRTSASLPRMLNPNSLLRNPDYEVELSEMELALRDENGVIVLFDTLADRRHYLPSDKELNQHLRLVRLSRWRDEGTLYRLAPP